MKTSTTTQDRTAAPDLDAAFDARLGLELAADHHDDDELEGEIAAEHDPGLRRYLRWQFLDFFKTRAIFLIPLGILGLWIFRDNYDAVKIAEGVARAADQGVDGVRTEAALFQQLVLGISAAAGVLGSIVSATGIVSRDRERGLQRFLFAKPIRITSYYLQSFAVNGVGLMLAVAGLLALTSLVFMRPVPIMVPLLAAAGSYLAVGGLTLLASTLVRFDLAIAGLLTVLSVPLHAAAQEGRWWAVATSWLLPPVHTMEAVVEYYNRGGNLGPVLNGVAMMAAYGVAYISAAVAVIRKRSIVG